VPDPVDPIPEPSDPASEPAGPAPEPVEPGAEPIEPGAEPIEPGAEPAASAAELAGPDARLLPVLAEPRAIERPEPVSLPAALAAATGGFVLGVATFLLVRVLRRPRRARRLAARGKRGRGEQIDIAATRSFLVDIHLLNRR
jgi:hypothetical protein